MSWLETHIEEFVIPNLKKMDEDYITSLAEAKMCPRDEIDSSLHNSVGSFNRTGLFYFTPEEKTVIKNVWRATKKNAAGKTILLAGRDVFIFEILARRENYPTVFIPECSRATVKSAALRNRIGNVDDYYLFDTGFVGSIPKNLGIKNFGLFSYSSMLDKPEFRGVGKQIFPRMTWSRALALRIENTPKYWESARMVVSGGEITNGIMEMKDEILQPLSNRMQFEMAARLTIEIYTDSSPKFVKKHRPIVKERGW